MASELTTYEQWRTEQRWPGHEELPGTLDEVDRLAIGVAHHGDDGSLAETLAIVTDGLLTELRTRRAREKALREWADGITNSRDAHPIADSAALEVLAILEAGTTKGGS